MKNNTFSILTAISAFIITASISIVFATAAHAYIQPTLTLTNLGNGSVQITVAGDADASIQLFYYTSLNGAAGGPVATAGVIGNTAVNGYFSTTLSGYPSGYSSTGYAGNYNAYINAIPYGAPVYVVVDGLQSASVAWPYSANGTVGINPGGPITGVNGVNGGIYFNVSTINLNAGQSQNVQIYQNSGAYAGGSYYISSNSNSSVVTANVSGSSVYIAAVAPGNATITVCQTNTAYNYPYTTTVGNGNGLCASLYVTVNYVNSYPSYPTYPTYINPVTTYAALVQQITVPAYIPATVYSAPAYSYSYPYSTYPVTYPAYTTTSAYYSTPTYYPY